MTTHWWKEAAAVALGLMIASVAMADSVANPSTRPAATDNSAQSPWSADDLTGLTIEQLLNVEVVTPAGLTATDVRHMPVDVTELDSVDVEGSGAKDLNDLLEDYVPNAQVIDHNTPGNDLGFRGIISDRDDKYLYQVNGVTLNNHMLYGAENERDLPLMGDINTVDVVEGPASATYGSGALAGVVDVNAYNGLTFQGADLTVRQGIEDEYTASELRFGRRFSADSGLFIYYGFAQEQGADAPYYIGTSHAASNGLPANVAGQPYEGPKQWLGAAAFGAPWQKAHISYVDGPWEIWTRFTQDGTDTQPRRDIYTHTKPADETLDEWVNGRSIESQVSTTALNFNKDIAPDWNLEALQSTGIWAVKDQREGVTPTATVRNSNEYNLFSREIATWTPSSAESLAFGTEYEHEWFHDPPTSDALDRAPVVTTRDWQTDTISFLAENQWKIDKQLTLFVSVRTDKNTLSNWLLSPRATLVYTPTRQDTFKYIAGEAVRRADDEDLWGQWERTRTIVSPETLKTIEISYERKLTDQWTFTADEFFEDYNAIGWDPHEQEATSLGHFQIAGGDLILQYKTEGTRVTVSEGVSQLVYGSVPGGSPAASQGISSAPYGFGDNLAAWAPSITKLAVTHDFSKQWSASTSVVYYSGFPGAQDYANYSATLVSPPSGVPLSSPGYSTPYGPNMYVNVGLEYRPTENWTFRVDGYNLAALADPTLSKRNNILRESEFSVQPAAMAISARYAF